MPYDLPVVRLDGSVAEGLGGMSAAVVAMHAQVYRARPQAGAVIHTHSASAGVRPVPVPVPVPASRTAESAWYVRLPPPAEVRGRRVRGNTYVREDQVLPHLAAIGILLAGPAAGNRGPAQVTGPADTAALIEQLRANGVVLTYDPHDRTLRAGGHDPLSVAIGQDH